jgi:hypothetical protein
MSEEIALDKEDRAKLAKALVMSDAWKYLMLPHIEGLREKHLAACISRKSTPAERAEHIEAAHGFSELIQWPESIISDYERSQKNSK